MAIENKKELNDKEAMDLIESYLNAIHKIALEKRIDVGFHTSFMTPGYSFGMVKKGDQSREFEPDPPDPQSNK